MKRTSSKLTAMLTGKRRYIQVVLGFGVYAAMSAFGLSLWWILGIGAVSGIVFGKVFCRWACPIGFIMELITGMGGGNNKFMGMYQYHKIGCPIAWVSGFLNKFSVLKIRLEPSTCTRCGLCDKACYMSTLEPNQYSLFRQLRDRPGDAFACSRCLSCVTACPTGSLSYGTGKPIPIGSVKKS